MDYKIRNDKLRSAKGLIASLLAEAIISHLMGIAQKNRGDVISIEAVRSGYGSTTLAQRQQTQREQQVLVGIGGLGLMHVKLAPERVIVSKRIMDRSRTTREVVGEALKMVAKVVPKAVISYDTNATYGPFSTIVPYTRRITKNNVGSVDANDILELAQRVQTYTKPTTAYCSPRPHQFVPNVVPNEILEFYREHYGE